MRLPDLQAAVGNTDSLEDRGVIDENVHHAECVARVPDQIPGCLCIGEIRMEGLCPDA
jgi:hypothetical protein